MLLSGALLTGLVGTAATAGIGPVDVVATASSPAAEAPSCSATPVTPGACDAGARGDVDEAGGTVVAPESLTVSGVRTLPAPATQEILDRMEDRLDTDGSGVARSDGV